MRKANLQSWVNDLRKKNMPVLGAVIAELNKITGCDQSNANQLAEVILRDPNLTSHVLRVANSVQYNYSNQKINTISRAIVLIGLKGMRAICISLLILDRLLNDAPKERVIALVAQGFHAATQAQNIIETNDASIQEEVFIAGLLYNLGEMCFWMSDKSSNPSPDLMSSDPKVRKKAIDETIGGSFKALTRELGRHWKLGDTLQEALYPDDKPSLMAQAVITGERLSRAALFGWDSPQVKKVIGEVAKQKGIKPAEALIEVKKGADKAGAVAMSYGASDAYALIPCSKASKAVSQAPEKSKIMKPDPSVQLSILRELSSAAAEKTNVNTIFQMVLEGMHRGVGLERVSVAFIKGHKVKSKYALGEGTAHWGRSFMFDVGPYTDNIFTYAIEKDDPLWVTESMVGQHQNLYTDDIVTALGRRPSLVFVIRIKKRASAVFYADRGNFGGKIDDEQFESFKHFALQAQMNLNLASEKEL